MCPRNSWADEFLAAKERTIGSELLVVCRRGIALMLKSMNGLKKV
jgi:hypothetical protein